MPVHAACHGMHSCSSAWRAKGLHSAEEKRTLHCAMKLDCARYLCAQASQTQGLAALSPPFHPLFLHGMETQNTGFLPYHNTPYRHRVCALSAWGKMLTIGTQGVGTGSVLFHQAPYRPRGTFPCCRCCSREWLVGSTGLPPSLVSFWQSAS